MFVTHGLYPAEELEKVRQAFAGRIASDDEVPTRLSATRVDLAAAPVAPAWASEIAALRSELDNLRGTRRRTGCRGARTEIGAGSLME